MERQMTRKERHWLSHVERAHQKGQSLSEYAMEHDLDLRTMYRWHWTLRKRGWLGQRDALVGKPAFVPLRIEATVDPLPWRVDFPNGVRLELSMPQTPEQCALLLNALRTLS